MTVTYWTGFSKRKNSTKQPTSGTDATVKLKDNCSVINPTIQTVGIPANANYFYISDFGRYYFVSNVTKISNAITEFNLEVDVLASYKTNIGSTKAMILRSSSTYNVWLPDNRVYVSAQKTIVREATSTNVGFADSTGVYLLSVINEDGCATGFACQYFDNGTGMQALANDLMNSSFIADVMKYSSNVSAGVVSLKWMPFNYSEITTSGFVTLENYKIANVSFNNAGYRITGTSYYIDGAVTIPIPWRSDKDFREANPYSVIKLLIPMYGLVDLNASDLVGCTNVYVQYRADRSTGDVTVIINADTAGAVIQTLQFNVAVEVPIATLTRDIGSAVSALTGGVNSAIGIAAGNYIGGTAGLISNAASFALAANGRSVSAKGSLQGKSITALGNVFQLLLYTNHTLDPTDADFIATQGRPLQAVDSISNHSGFILCDNASCTMPGSALEKERVNNYLNSGFFYE